MKIKEAGHAMVDESRSSITNSETSRRRGRARRASALGQHHLAVGRPSVLRREQRELLMRQLVGMKGDIDSLIAGRMQQPFNRAHYELLLQLDSARMRLSYAWTSSLEQLLRPNPVNSDRHLLKDDLLVRELSAVLSTIQKLDRFELRLLTRAAGKLKILAKRTAR